MSQYDFDPSANDALKLLRMHHDKLQKGAKFVGLRTVSYMSKGPTLKLTYRLPFDVSGDTDRDAYYTAESEYTYEQPVPSSWNEDCNVCVAFAFLGFGPTEQVAPRLPLRYDDETKQFSLDFDAMRRALPAETFENAPSVEADSDEYEPGISAKDAGEDA